MPIRVYILTKIFVLCLIIAFNYSCKIRKPHRSASSLQSLNILDCINVCEDILQRVKETKTFKDKMKLLLFLTQEGRDIAGALILRGLVYSELTGQQITLTKLYKNVANTDKDFIDSLKINETLEIQGKRIPWSNKEVSKFIVNRFANNLTSDEVITLITDYDLQTLNEWLNELKGQNSTNISNSLKDQILGFYDKINIIYTIAKQKRYNSLNSIKKFSDILSLRLGSETLVVLTQGPVNSDPTNFIKNQIIIPISRYNLDLNSKISISSYALEYLQSLPQIDIQLEKIIKTMLKNYILYDNQSILSLLETAEYRASLFSGVYNHNPQLITKAQSKLAQAQFYISIPQSIFVDTQKNSEQYLQDLTKLIKTDLYLWTNTIEQKPDLKMIYDKIKEHPRLTRIKILTDKLLHAPKL